MRKRLLVANWKMYLNLEESVELIDFYKAHFSKEENVKVIVCPSNVWLYECFKKLKNSSIGLGIQNIHFLPKGAVTGEVSAPMAKEYAKYVIIGHSERRKFFCETNEAVNQKVKMALKNGLIPIICYGEDRKEEGIDHTLAQVSKAISGVSKDDIRKIIFAYEPVWAIGTGNVATPNHVSSMIESARERLSLIYNREIVNRIKFLYGGSVNGRNIRSFLDEKNIDGFLVGGASTEPKSFSTIYNNLLGGI